VRVGRHTLRSAHVEEDQTGSKRTYAEKERVKRNKERRNGRRVIRGRGLMERNKMGETGERRT